MTINDVWVVTLSQPDSDVHVQVSVERGMPTSVGRTSEANASDISAFGEAARSVSRQHVRFSVREDGIHVEDLSSANGTRLNNVALAPDISYRVDDGDTLHLGSLVLTLKVSKAPAQRKGDTDNIPQTSGDLVLVVEDDPETAKLYSLMLSRQGLASVTVGDVTRAIRALQRHSPAAVVLDMMLPGVDGLEFCRYVRLDAVHKALPIVVVTANYEGYLTRAMEAGADLVLQKPVSTAELGRAVQAQIARANGQLSEAVTKALETSVPQQPMAEQAEGHVTVFAAGHKSAPLVLDARAGLHLGRTDGTAPLGGQRIDLERFNASTLGVSRHHAVLTYTDGVYRLRDENSTNGTFVNGVRLNPGSTVPLSDGSEVRLGRLSLVIYFLGGRTGQAETSLSSGSA